MAGEEIKCNKYAQQINSNSSKGQETRHVICTEDTRKWHS